MAQTFKTIDKTKDIKSFKTKLHEAIPITGTIAYGIYTNETNVRKYTHGQFQSVYDYPYLSSSANAIFDLTFGVQSGWSDSDDGRSFGAANIVSSSTDKQNIYQQMAQNLVGHDITGAIMPFDHWANPAQMSDMTTKFKTAFFMNFSRMLVKDEIAKETFVMYVGTGSLDTTVSATAYDKSMIRLSDSGSKVYTNSPAGEYGIIYTGSAGVAPKALDAVGLLYYQAGIAVLELSGAHGSTLGHGLFNTASAQTIDLVSHSSGDHLNVASASLSASIDEICDGFRQRIGSISFNNTIELNSTVYFCRANASEFNYSANPTYIDSTGKIRVKTYADDSAVSYITTVGLYHSDGALMAVGKLSEPIKKTEASDFTIRVRLDY
jgi:hypothetical protein